MPPEVSLELCACPSGSLGPALSCVSGALQTFLVPCTRGSVDCPVLCHDHRSFCRRKGGLQSRSGVGCSLLVVDTYKFCAV